MQRATNVRAPEMADRTAPPRATQTRMMTGMLHPPTELNSQFQVPGSICPNEVTPPRTTPPPTTAVEESAACDHVRGARP